jgi:hypothetical protein
MPFTELERFLSQGGVALDLMRRNPEREVSFNVRTVVYLAAGLPVIYNDFAELSGWIRDYQAGWTLDPDDTDLLKQILAEIAGNPELVKQRAAGARKLVEERLSSRELVEPLLAFCREPFVREVALTVSEAETSAATGLRIRLEAQERLLEMKEQHIRNLETSRDRVRSTLPYRVYELLKRAKGQG